jgi:hypothetical protein
MLYKFDVQTCTIQSNNNGKSIKEDPLQLERTLSSINPINRRDAIAQYVAPPVTLKQVMFINIF